jgi:hypothetical protein
MKAKQSLVNEQIKMHYFERSNSRNEMNVKRNYEQNEKILKFP